MFANMQKYKNYKLQVHDCKYEKSPNHKITNYKVIIVKLQVN